MSVIINGSPWRLQQDNSLQATVLGPWTEETTNILNRGTYAAPEIVTKSRVYLFGGGMSGKTNIITAPIDGSGVIGAWTDHGASLPVDKTGMQAVLTKNRVYLIGGNTSAIYTAPIDPATGLLGTIVSAGVSTPWTSQNIDSCIVTKNRIFVFRDGSSSYAFIDLDANGVILGTSWTTGSQDDARYGSGFVYVNNRTGAYDRIYRAGGSYSSVFYPYISFISIDKVSGATFGSWSRLGSVQLATAINMMRCVVTMDRLFVIGGNISGNGQTIVQSCPIYADATLGPFVQHSNPLIQGVSSPSIVVTSSRIYAIGGSDSSYLYTTVQYADFAGGANDYINASYINEDDREASGNYGLKIMSLVGNARVVSPWESVGLFSLPRMEMSGFAGFYFEANAPHEYQQSNGLRINGSASTAWYATGNFRLNGITARGTGPNGGSFTVKPLSVSGMATANHVAVGSYKIGDLSASGTAEYRQLVAAFGAFRLSQLSVGGQGEGQDVLSGAYAIPLIRIGGSAALRSDFVSAGFTLPKILISGKTTGLQGDVGLLQFSRGDAADARIFPSEWEGEILHFSRQ